MTRFIALVVALLLGKAVMMAVEYRDGIAHAETVQLAQGKPATSPADYLPLGLQYMMQKDEVSNLLRAFGQYQIDTVDRHMLAYIIPDPATDSKTGLFLQFYNGGLVQVTSGRYEMTKVLYDVYFPKILATRDRLKQLGVTTLSEVPADAFYAYSDDISYIIISGGQWDVGYKAEIAFKFRDWEDQRN
ncbi:MAG: hypothetical protein RIM72_01430 [Alphaproteobacteria bacterium]